MKKLFYIRHGETVMNAAGIITGQLETPLNETGKLQAKQSGDALRERVGHVDLIVTSTFERAYDTAKIIATEIGYDIDTIERNSLFDERTFGIYDGTLRSEFMLHHEYQEFDTAEGAEPVEHLQNRALAAFEYVQAIDADVILIVGHAAFGRAFRRVVQGRPYTDEYGDNPQIHNAEILELI